MIFDFIPINLYTPLYFHVMLIVVLLVFFHLKSNYENTVFLKTSGFLLFWFVLLYMGLRPIDGVFVDMTTYARKFHLYKMGYPIINKKDVFFNYFTFYSAKFFSAQVYFFICAALYVVPLYFVSTKLFKKYWFYGFLFLVVSFSFWAYGTNGIRNGIAGSIFLLAITRNKRIFQAILIILAIGFHKTMTLPTIGFILANLIKKTNYYVLLWIATIPLSIIMPGFWENLFAGLGFDDRFSEYVELTEDYTSSGLFRWDFLLYSSIAVFTGWYYIYVKNFNDKIYNILFIVYTFSNAFWILVIRSGFSNRFAYLSWFSIAIVIVYPLLNKKIFNNQKSVLRWLLLGYFSFTYIMNVFL